MMLAALPDRLRAPQRVFGAVRAGTSGRPGAAR
jgi:hypothetical protein